MATSNPGPGSGAAAALRRARLAAGLGLRAMARRAGTSHATLSAYENGAKAPNTTTFERILGCAGFAIDFELSPRMREADGRARGEELLDVLVLAGQFPARPGGKLAYPVLRDLRWPA
jgi:transcriptional regulator with XRE-family HTH domain